MNKKSSDFWLFMIGMWSQTQIHLVGSLGISEFPIFLVAPFVFLIGYRELRQDGLLPFICLTIFTCIGSVLSGKVNHVYNVEILRGLASPYAIFAEVVVFHRLLRRNFGGLKWIIFGAFISGIISIFVFQPETYTMGRFGAATGQEAVEAVTGYALFWSKKISSLMNLPISCMYFKTPLAYIIAAPLFEVGLKLVISHGSGRAAALVTMASVVMLAFGRKSRERMFSIRNRVFLFMVVGLVSLLAFKVVYSQLAKQGILGPEAQEKYEKQTRMGSSALRILMSGRMEFFCGVMAAMDRPIIGFGNNALDEKGYALDYLQKYGAPEDYNMYARTMYDAAMRGQIPRIPAHSHIASFWLYHGIFGLLLWLYVLWLMWLFVRRNSAAIPQWYGYFCLAIPATGWAIFFSPFGARVGETVLITCLLLAKAVGQHRMYLPPELEQEARKYS